MSRQIYPDERVALPVSHADWLNITEALTKPWPAAAVRVDLDFRDQLDDSERALLGRGTCAARWGWTESCVRRAFEGRGPSARR